MTDKEKIAQLQARVAELEAALRELQGAVEKAAGQPAELPPITGTFSMREPEDGFK
jgi:hypothetical protein